MRIAPFFLNKTKLISDSRDVAKYNRNLSLALVLVQLHTFGLNDFHHLFMCVCVLMRPSWQQNRFRFALLVQMALFLCWNGVRKCDSPKQSSCHICDRIIWFTTNSYSWIQNSDAWRWVVPSILRVRFIFNSNYGSAELNQFPYVYATIWLPPLIACVIKIMDGGPITILKRDTKDQVKEEFDVNTLAQQ